MHNSKNQQVLNVQKRCSLVVDLCRTFVERCSATSSALARTAFVGQEHASRSSGSRKSAMGVAMASAAGKTRIPVSRIRYTLVFSWCTIEQLTHLSRDHFALVDLIGQKSANRQ